jgi:hypothetical protein
MMTRSVSYDMKNDIANDINDIVHDVIIVVMTSKYIIMTKFGRHYDNMIASLTLCCMNHPLNFPGNFHESKGKWRRKPPAILYGGVPVQFGVEGKHSPEGFVLYKMEDHDEPIIFHWTTANQQPVRIYFNFF